MNLNKQEQKKLTLTVSVEEANKIFKALGNLPFVEVYELIGKLNEQANSQLRGDSSVNSFVINGTPVKAEKSEKGKDRE